MSTSLPPASLPSVAAVTGAVRRSLFRRLLRNPLGVASLAVLVLVVLAAVLAPVLAPMDPNRAAAADTLSGPGAHHLLGADGSGHDILSRLLYASRLSLAAAVVALVVAAVIGITAGLLSGYYGRWFETASSWVASMFMALPGIVVLLAARSVLGPSVFTAMAIFGVLLSPAFYRVVSAAVSAVRGELYVDAARVSGLSDTRIIVRHVLTVVRAPAIILAAGIAGVAISVQAGLDFLGLGDPTKPTWGGMLSDAFSNIYTAPLMLLWPSLAIGLTSMALVLLANALRDELEHTAGAPGVAPGGPGAAPAEPPREPVVVHHDPAQGSSTPLLDVRGLAVGYDRSDGSVATVVQDVSLAVRRGEVHGLVGESGSGKTQTAWSILRLLPPGGRLLAGVVDFDGTDVAGLSDKEMRGLLGRRIAYVPQEPMSNLDPSFTIGHQLVEPMRTALGIGKGAARERALALLERVGIPDPQRTYDAFPHQISGGMAQRVLIAGAVSCGPDLLIADEPTTALDVTVQAEVLDLLRDLRAERDMGILLVTHNFGVVADICDRVSVMRNGRIVETGPTRAVFADPQHAYTRSLFAAVLGDGTDVATAAPALDGAAVAEGAAR